MIDKLRELEIRREELDNEIAELKYNMLNTTIIGSDNNIYISSFSGWDKLHVAKLGIEDFFLDKTVEILLTKDMIVDIVNTFNNYLEE